MAVGWRAHDGFGADIATTTRPIFDNKLLAKSLGQPLSDQARGDVRCPGRCEWNDDPHWPGRIGLPPCNVGHDRQRGSARGEMQEFAAWKLQHGSALRMRALAARAWQSAVSARHWIEANAH